jgi:hypothetical protein
MRLKIGSIALYKPRIRRHGLELPEREVEVIGWSDSCQSYIVMVRTTGSVQKKLIAEHLLRAK